MSTSEMSTTQRTVAPERGDDQAELDRQHEQLLHELRAIIPGAEVLFAFLLTGVLTMDEASVHPHVQARGTVVEEHGLLQPAPAPRFSRTPGAIQRPPAWPGQHTDEVLADWGFGVLRDRQVPLNVIFGVFAAVALLSIGIVLMIRPRGEEGRS